MPRGNGDATDQLVEVVRRYSRQPHHWRTSKRLVKILAEAPKAARPTPRTMPHVHKLEQRMSAEVVTALVSDYKSGMTSTELRAKYELGKGSVQRLLREAKVRRRRHSLTNVEIVGLVQRYEAGLTIREIAGDKGLPKTTVQNALKRSGLRRRPAARRDGISQRKQ